MSIRILFAALLCLALQSPAPRAQEGDPLFTGLAVLAQTDPERALTEIEAALDRLATDPGTPPRVVFDLNRLAADLLLGLDRPAEAAPLYAQLGQVALSRPALDIDPLPLWKEAARAFMQAGLLDRAIAAEEAVEKYQREASAPPEAIAATLLRLAELSGTAGDTAAEDAYRTAAAEALAPADTDATRSTGQGFTRVPVFYATDRAPTGSADPSDFYGYGRGNLAYGVAEVTIPDSHVAGAIERPSVWRLEFAPSPTRHVMLRSVEPLAADAFFTRMNATLGERDRPEIVVFVHGYNVTFSAAARRAAQLAHDMSYPGLPVLYSWPSRGSTIGYLNDAAVVQLSGRRLARFLQELAARSGAETIHLVAHSMGNRALTEALEIMALKRGTRTGDDPVFEQVVFAAPDVDAGLFAEMLPTFRPLARRVTLYASENDWALVASRKLHGDAPRAGQGGDDTMSLPIMDTVDMSALGEDMLAHGYFADDSSALVDLVAMFWRNLPPAQRCGLTQHAKGGGAWLYNPDICPDNTLLAVLSNLQFRHVETTDDALRTMEELVTDPALLSEVEPVVQRMLSR